MQSSGAGDDMFGPPQPVVATPVDEDPLKAISQQAPGSILAPSTAQKAIAASSSPPPPGSQPSASRVSGTASNRRDEPVDATKQHVEPSEWRQLLCDALHASAPPGRFACSGHLEAPWLCPDISVAGVGRLALPLSKEQAVSLRSVAKQAPHGRGSRTVVDTAVRDGLQVDASQISIGSSWQPVLKSAVSEIASLLAMKDGSCGLEARLYKLLLYEQGGHFIAHQDTEKERGMIGTLVVQLPTAEGHTGGTLTVRHKGEEFTHHFAEDSNISLQYAAFFADCEHELSPITSGTRLALVYNLVWVGAPGQVPWCHTMYHRGVVGETASTPMVKKITAEVQLKRALQAWEQDIDIGGQQKAIAILLDHKYTEANLCFNHLKGTDRAMVRPLLACEEVEAHLVLVTRTKRIDCANDCKTEVIKCGKWMAMDGSAIDYREMHPEQNFYDPGGNKLFDDDDRCDAEEWEGYTGNEGTAVEIFYKRALLVLWPRSQTLENAKQAGFHAVLLVLKMRIREALRLYPRHSNNGAKEEQQQQQQQPEAQETSNGGSSASHCAACADVLAALQSCTQLLEHSPQQAVPGSKQSSMTEPNITSVLKQGIKAVQLGIQGGAESVQNLVTLASASEQGLAETSLVEALVAAAGVLDAAAVGQPLGQLVARCIVQQPENCITLIQGVSAHPQLQRELAKAALARTRVTMVDTLLLLAIALPAVPDSIELQQQVGNKLVAALKHKLSAQDVNQVAAALHKLDQQPELQQRLTAAAADAMISLGPVKHLYSCIQLLKASRNQIRSDTKQKLVQAVAAALLDNDNVWQASTAVQLATVLQDIPDLELMRVAITERLFKDDTLLSSQSDDSMRSLSSMLLSHDQLRAAYYQRFAAAVTQRPENYSLLKQLLEASAVQAALAMPEVQQLVSCQIANLERMSVVTPFSWHMPEARIPSNCKVEEFLRGPDQTYTEDHWLFSEARSAALNLHHGRCRSFNPPGDNSTYSFTTTAVKVGRRGQLVIKKTRGWYQRLLIAKEQLKDELQAVKALKVPA